MMRVAADSVRTDSYNRRIDQKVITWISNVVIHDDICRCVCAALGNGLSSARQRAAAASRAKRLELIGVKTGIPD